MPNEKVVMATLLGPADMVDTAIRNFIINRDVHLENAVDAMEGIKRLSPFEMKNPYAGMLETAYGLLRDTGLPPRYEDFAGLDLTPESAEAYLSDLAGRMKAMSDLRQEKLDEIERGRRISADLRSIQGIDVNLSDILNMKFVKFRFGRVHREDAEDFHSFVDSREDFFYFTAHVDAQWEYGLCVTLPGATDRIDSLFASLGWERIRLAEESMSIEGTPDEAVAELEKKTAEAQAKVEELTRAVALVKETESKKLLACYSYARFLSEAYDLRAYAGQRNGKFYIIGWVPAEGAQEFAARCEQIDGFGCILSGVKGERRRNPPTKMRAGRLSSIFRPFVDMYGSPANDEADPVWFITLTYTLVFGMMFGDVGQGAVLCAAGLLLWKFRRMWLGRVLAVVGVSGMGFGFVYGSVFGNEHLLPGFKVLEDGNAMRMLIVSMLVGMLLIFSSMVMNVVNGIRQRDPKKILFSPNGIAGFIVYASAAFGLVSIILFGRNIMTTPYILGLMVLPMLFIMSAEPLTKLLTKKRPWLPHSVGMFFIEGFFELFEMVLSYVSNTVSFLRVGAYAISHAGMMMVVYMLSGGGSNIVGLVVGNAIVIGIEATLVCIQVMRLEFYELLGRFYAGDGRKFVPPVIDYEKTQLG